MGEQPFDSNKRRAETQRQSALWLNTKRQELLDSLWLPISIILCKICWDPPHIADRSTREQTGQITQSGCPRQRSRNISWSIMKLFVVYSLISSKRTVMSVTECTFCPQLPIMLLTHMIVSMPWDLFAKLHLQMQVNMHSWKSIWAGRVSKVDQKLAHLLELDPHASTWACRSPSHASDNSSVDSNWSSWRKWCDEDSWWDVSLQGTEFENLTSATDE